MSTVAIVGGAAAVTGAVNELTDGDVSPLEMNLVRAFSLFAIGISVAAIVEVDHILVDIASFFTVAFALYLANQKQQLKYFGTIKSNQNKLENEAEELKEANDKLKDSVDGMGSTVDKTKQLEEELRTLVNTSDVSTLVSLTQEQSKISKEIKKNLKARVIQDVLQILLKSDSDSDMHIGENEIQILFLRLKMIDGLTFNEKKLKEKILDQHVSKVMDLLRDMINDDFDDGKSGGIFQISLRP